MTEDQQRFFEILDNYKSIQKFWNARKLELDIPKLQQKLNHLSTGEKHMARFFASVWLGQSTSFPFDVLDAIRDIDSKSRNIVLKWLKKPFFP